MLISEKQFKKIRVETQSKQYLGQLVSFDFETDTGKIVKYHVRKNLLSEILLIDTEQVISLDDKIMIVEDSLIKEKQSVVEKVEEIEDLKKTEPVITSEKS